jgi:hypothetical protein
MEKKKNRNEENFPKLCMNKDNQVWGRLIKQNNKQNGSGGFPMLLHCKGKMATAKLQ